MELMSINEFAWRSGLSPKALRLYDEWDCSHRIGWARSPAIGITGPSSSSRPAFAP